MGSETGEHRAKATGYDPHAPLAATVAAGIACIVTKLKFPLPAKLMIC